MAFIEMDFASGGASESGKQLFLGLHPYNGGTGYKQWEVNTFDSEYFTYTSGGYDLTVVKNFVGCLYYLCSGNDTHQLEINGTVITTTSNFELTNYSFKQGDVIKHKRNSTSSEYTAIISIFK